MFGSLPTSEEPVLHVNVIVQVIECCIVLVWFEVFRGKRSDCDNEVTQYITVKLYLLG